MTIVWLPIKGYEGVYEVSSSGFIRSVTRVDCKGRKRNSVTLVGGADKDGYRLVTLSVNAKHSGVRVHRIVALHFLPASEKTLVNHINGIKDDNRAENLEWCTDQENRDHAVVMGLMANGERNNVCKLSDADVSSIRNYSVAGMCNADIARKFNVSKAQIGNILLGKQRKRTTIPSFQSY